MVTQWVPLLLAANVAWLKLEFGGVVGLKQQKTVHHHCM